MIKIEYRIEIIFNSTSIPSLAAFEFAQERNTNHINIYESHKNHRNGNDEQHNKDNY